MQGQLGIQAMWVSRFGRSLNGSAEEPLVFEKISVWEGQREAIGSSARNTQVTLRYQNKHIQQNVEKAETFWSGWSIWNKSLRKNCLLLFDLFRERGFSAPFYKTEWKKKKPNLSSVINSVICSSSPGLWQKYHRSPYADEIFRQKL